AIALTIARAIASKPSVLIVDRTLDQLDPRAAQRAVDQLFAERDVTFLVISEDPAIQRCVDRHIDLSRTLARAGAAS
ncbi:MAG: hypothetical protein WCE62_04720, partial [Polyangiales bacterium]